MEYAIIHIIAIINIKINLFLFPFTELISAQPNPAVPTHLKDLFPGSYSVHFPDIEKLGHGSVQSIPNFSTLNGEDMVEPAATYLKRGKVIFGWLKGDDDIEALDLLFGKKHLFAVFNTENQQWYTLPSSELEKLGVNRGLRYVSAHDAAHAVVHNRYLRYRNRPSPQAHAQAHPQAHHAASEAAFFRTKNYEEAQRNYHQITAGTPELDVQSFKNVYDEAYNEAYQRHVGGTSGGR